MAAFYTNSLHPKATLRKILEGWRSKPFSAEELSDFDLSVLAKGKTGNTGLPCQVNVVQEIKNNEARSRIASVIPIPRGMEIPEQFNKSVTYDVSEGKNEVFRSFSERMQAYIARCDEMNPLAHKVAESLAAPAGNAGQPLAGPLAEDDSLPF
jgi:hypothetical protein